MLIDLEWDKEQNHNFKKYVTNFNTENGGLVVDFNYPNSDKTYTNRVATRFHKGIYYGFDLWNSIEMFTSWEVEHPWTELKKVITALETSDEEEAARFQKLIAYSKSEYGNADNLKQIFRYGRKFIYGEHPYALGIYYKNIENDDRFLDKNGPYIGNLKNPKEIVHFSFFKLIRKKSHENRKFG